MGNPVKNFFAHVFNGEITEALKSVQPDCVFEAQGPNNVPIYGIFKGHDGVKDFLSILSELFDTENFECRQWAEADNYVFSYGYMQHRVKKTNKVFKSEWALVCQTENGLIKSYKMFEDTAALQAAYL
ncbi:MAG: nuclear transport factor 2 family protein [Zymomonas mobilis]|uniref:Ketosteroid isomerase-like protein n=1 Tax=Zymomonas mobilis TaxID=542 RepID=A0A542VYS8_ZYMMB|nr:nuclear transport factor 2 family protein [Zymomonas mobilis]TQL16479.1 ketosteroid isomerase-like protein [Zymomonas mobilis]